MLDITLYPAGIRPETAAHFQLAQNSEDDIGVFWTYPIYDVGFSFAGARRHYRTPERAPSHKAFEWEAPPDNACAFYNGREVEKVLEDDPGADIWICTCESDVWRLHEHGIAAGCVFSIDGIQTTTKWLHSIGRPHLHIVPPTSSNERQRAALWYKYARALQLDVSVHIYVGEEIEALATYLNRCESVNLPILPALLDAPCATKEMVLEWSKETKEAKENARSEALAAKAPVKGKKGGARESSTELAKSAIDAFLADESLQFKLYHSNSAEEFLSVWWENKRETYSLSSTQASQLLDDLYFEYTGTFASKETLENIKRVLRMRANRKSAEVPVAPRVCEYAGRIYIDLANAKGEVIEIGDDITGGWRIITDCPVIFRRAPGIQPLPRPIHNDNNMLVWAKFHRLFAPGTTYDKEGNIVNDNNWRLMIGWLFGCFRPPTTPYAGLCISGEQNSGKSERSKMLRALIDPNQVAFPKLPDTDRDLAIAAQQRFLLGFGNLSGIRFDQNDALCRAVEDGAFSTRKLHTDDEEKIFTARRPLLLNGIDAVIGKSDLRRRMIFVHIPRFESEDDQMTVGELWEAFNALAPAILGALLDAVAVALRNFPTTPNPRVGGGMLDFAKWVCAGEDALPWEKGEFITAYGGSLIETQRASLDEPFAQGIYRMMENKHGIREIRQSARELYAAFCYGAAENALQGAEDYEKAKDNSELIEMARIRERVLKELRGNRSIPSGEHAFGKELQRRAVDLRAMGIDCRYNKGAHQPWEIRWLDGFPEQAKEEQVEAPPLVDDGMFSEDE